MFSFQIGERTGIISGEWDSSFSILFHPFITLIFFLGTHPVGHHVPQTLCLAAASSYSLRRRTGSLAPCRAGPLPRDPFSSYASTGTISDKQWKYDEGRRLILVKGRISHRAHRKRKWIWHWLHQHVALSHKQSTQHQALAFFRQRRNLIPSTRSLKNKLFSFFLLSFIS